MRRSASEVIRNLEQRVARLERKSSRPLKRKASDKKTFKGEDCRLVMDSSGRHNSLTLTEIPAKGQKTVRETQWTFGWANQYVRQISSETGGMFLVQNIMMELTKLGGPEGKDYDENVALINTAIQNHMDKNFNAMEITPEKTQQVMRKTVENTIKGHESTLKASEVRPDNYREISFSGKGFHASCSWDSGRVTLSKDEDEYMAYNEGMTTHYATKTRASARKLWILIDKMGERAFSRMSGEDFLELLKKKRIAMQYVPTVWR